MENAIPVHPHPSPSIPTPTPGAAPDGDADALAGMLFAVLSLEKAGAAAPWLEEAGCRPGMCWMLIESLGEIWRIVDDMT